MSKQYYRPRSIQSFFWIIIFCLTHCSDSKKPTTLSAAQVQTTIAAMDRLIDSKQFDNAVRVARELSKQAASDPLASEALARALLSQCGAHPTPQLFNDTADAYAKAAAQRPTSPGLQSAAGVAAYSAGRVQDAITFHQKARALEPGNPQHLYLEAMMWSAIAQPDNAIELFTLAMKLQPDSPEIEIGFAEALAQSGEREQAATHVNRARTLAPLDVRIRLRAAGVLRVVGQADAAAEMLLGAVAIGSADAATFELCAQCLTDSGKHKESAQVWERLAAITMMQPRPLLEAARSWSRAGEHENALIFLEKARQANAPATYIEIVQSEIVANQKKNMLPLP